jgi:hypothetical protein
MASGADLHSVILAWDYRVPDAGHMWSEIEKRRRAPAGIGAHHLVVYTSLSEPGRVNRPGVRRRVGMRPLPANGADDHRVGQGAAHGQPD